MSRREQAWLRRYWAHLRLQFRADGNVWAQRCPGQAWGILLYARDAARALDILDPAATPRVTA